MEKTTETRVALALRGKALDFDQALLLGGGSLVPTVNQVAEAFEAILGAVYVDSGHDITVVKKVIKHIKLDDHKFLQQTTEQSKDNKEKGRIGGISAS